MIGLSGEQVTALAIDPGAHGVIYAGTRNSGVFKTTNGGQSWLFMSPGLVSSLQINPSTPATIYMASWSSGIYKSINGGVTWTAMNVGLSNTFVQALTIDPSSPDTLYAGTDGSGVFKTTDGAATWQPTGTDFGQGALPAATISKVSGDNQTGTTGHPLRYPLVVVVTNSAGIPVNGVTVSFAVTSGAGTLSTANAVSDSQGVASTQLTLGAIPGTSIVSASAEGLTGSPLMFTISERKRAGQLVSQ